MAGNLVSRLLVAAAGLPLVSAGLGRRLVALRLALVVGVLALHEYYAMTRPLRPILIAGYLGLLLTLLALEAGGLAWVAGRPLHDLRAGVHAQGGGETRQSATVSVGATMLGVAWIGLGLVYLLALRTCPNAGACARSRCCSPCGRGTRSPSRWGG